jgi:hypothetical protein
LNVDGQNTRKIQGWWIALDSLGRLYGNNLYQYDLPLSGAIPMASR